ncbi:hypothetical protein MTR67_001708 [Solanum verrucosum]|uniref:Uncharacterized protein n=1 Tax=Solanum verrucosum TaxID=315347 RepID=A0AAF0PNN7_SOLVR|nr:hypothetical protein MTR67_001708 [Solanum verrucosum]
MERLSLSIYNEVGGLCAFLCTLFLGHIGACTSIWRLSSFERRRFSIFSGICSEFLGGMVFARFARELVPFFLCLQLLGLTER